MANDYKGETERLLTLGATKLNKVESGGTRWTTFADVEGNELDPSPIKPPATRKRRRP
jgi:hypothetical protein